MFPYNLVAYYCKLYVHIKAIPIAIISVNDDIFYVEFRTTDSTLTHRNDIQLSSFFGFSLVTAHLDGLLSILCAS